MKRFCDPTLTVLAAAAFLTSISAQAELTPEQQTVMQRMGPEVEVRFDLPYAGTTNRKQMVDLYLPKKPANDKPLPVVCYIHGGGWVNGDRIGAASAMIRKARTGHYAGVAIGYRLTKEAQWPAQIHDVKAAIRWVRGHAKEFNLDAEHIAVWGSSAGGHLVSLLGTSGDVKELEGSLGEFTGLSSRVSCVVNICGPQDMAAPLMKDKEGKPIVDDPAVCPLIGGSMAEKRAVAVAASPLTYVSKDDAPFITGHGTEDGRVDFANATKIDTALKAVGVPSILVPVTGGAHSFGSQELDRRIDQFIDLHLRGIAAEIPATAVPDERGKAAK